MQSYKVFIGIHVHGAVSERERELERERCERKKERNIYKKVVLMNPNTTRMRKAPKTFV